MRSGERRYLLGISRFAELLGDGAPQHHLKTTDRAAVHSVAAMIAEHVRNEKKQDLTAIGRDLVVAPVSPDPVVS